MKKLIALTVFIGLLFSCKSAKIDSNAKPLFEILTQQKDGGASIQFYEILTEPKEIKMLLGDKKLKGKILESDLETCNFVILNSGYKNKGNNKIEIEKVIETPTQIIVTVKKNSSEQPIDIDLGTVNPYLILKINSKKEIVFE